MNWKKTLHIVAFVLVIVGALNWGLFGLFQVDLIEVLFGNMPTVAEVIYTLVGLSGVYLLVVHKDECKVCKGK